MPAPAEAFFLPAAAPEGGQRFCLFHAARDATGQPLTRPKGLVLYIHPFAEEMNKSRRMAALQTRAMASAGYAVLQIDLLGCGDSSGDFGDATWDAWLDDVALGLGYLRTRASQRFEPNGQPVADLASLADLPVWLWGLRAGCLLAVDAAKRLNEPCNFLFWQAPASGKLLLQQFLRLKVASEMASGQSKGLMDALRQQLAACSAVEIAGYSLASGLANGLEQSVLAPRASQPGQRVEWLEVSTRADTNDNAALSPVSEKLLALCRSQGFQVRSRLARGPAFWQTTEIVDAPDLLIQTLLALEAEVP